jgi:predicted MFS family arabinose efflux permease
VKLPAVFLRFYRRHWRWFVVATLFGSTLLNYLDRQVMAFALDPIANELGLDMEQRGRLLAAFIYVYAAAVFGIGFVLDRTERIRLLFPAMVLAWSLATCAMGLSRSYHDLLVLRMILGVFESINFPISLLLVGRIFPAKERALAVGIFTSGAVVASLLGPKLVIWLSTQWHWRWAFFAAGGLGLLWIVPWLLIFRQPAVQSVAWCESTRPSAPGGKELSLGELLRRPALWAVATVGVGLIPGGYFVAQWLPSYFTHEWSLPYDQALGNRLVLVYLAQDAGLLLGGIFAWWLAYRLNSVLAARRCVIFASYFIALGILTLPWISNLSHATFIICAYVFSLGAWNAAGGAFKQEVSTSRIAVAISIICFCETGFSAFVIHRVGMLAQASGGFGAIFPLLGTFLTLSVLVTFFAYRPALFPQFKEAQNNAGNHV